MILYSQTNCQPCNALKMKLKAKGIAFAEVNISQDKEAREFLMSKGLRSVPAVFVDGKQIDPNTL